MSEFPKLHSRHHHVTSASAQIKLEFVKLGLPWELELEVLAKVLECIANHIGKHRSGLPGGVTFDLERHTPRKANAAALLLSKASAAELTCAELQLLIGELITNSAGYSIRTERQQGDEE